MGGPGRRVCSPVTAAFPPTQVYTHSGGWGQASGHWFARAQLKGLAVSMCIGVGAAVGWCLALMQPQRPGLPSGVAPTQALVGAEWEVSGEGLRQRSW